MIQQEMFLYFLPAAQQLIHAHTNMNGTRVILMAVGIVVTVILAGMLWLSNGVTSASDKAEVAIGRVSEVEGDIKAIDVKLANILNILKNFK